MGAVGEGGKKDMESCSVVVAVLVTGRKAARSC